MSSRHPSARWDGRWIAAGMLAAYWLALKLTSFVVGRPIFELPPSSWFGPMAPYFADLRGVVSWSDQYCAGHTTHLEQIRDPWNRPINYHFWWLYLHDLGVNWNNVMAFGYAVDLIFLGAAFFVLGRLDRFGGLVAGVFLISYAVMFGLERANLDLLMFAFLALALAQRRFTPVVALLMGFAAILKVHPLFAFGALLSPPWAKTIPWLVAGLIFFVLGTTDHLSLFLSTLGTAPNMRSGVLSYGMTSFGLELTEYLHRPDLYLVVVSSGLFLLIVSTGVGAWVRPMISLRSQDERELFAFRVGAGSYLGCFLLGTNHDYRLIFLIFCLPLLLLLLQRDLARHWAFTSILLILIAVSWLTFAGDQTPLDFVLKHSVTWALYVCLVSIYIATLPPTWQWPRRPLSPTP